MVAKHQTPYFELLYARRGGIRATHGGVRSTVPQGGFVILNDQLAYELDFPDGSDCLTVRMPEAWAMQWLPDIRRNVGEPVGVYNPWGRPLAGLLTAIADSGLETAALTREVLADQIGAMGSLLASSAMDERRKTERGLVRRICDAVRDRHDDPDISPGLIANELQISTRHLHRVLARSGTSFGSFLNSVRVSAAESLLISSHTRHLQVGEIAWRVGFVDQSHFARIFRAAQGCSPSEFKRNYTQ
jgi:AraC-like DNA-binding protein